MKNIKYNQTLRTTLISITCITLIAIGQSTFAASLQNASSSVPLYGTFEAVVNAPEATGNKFVLFPSFTFSKGNKSFKVDAFFNGNGNGSPNGSNWTARFMPDETGSWNYTWSFLGNSGSGSFNVGSKSNPNSFGHVHRAGKYLKHDDGSAFFYRGTNWAWSAELHPNQSVAKSASAVYFSNQDWIAFANRAASTGHNGHWIGNLDSLMNNDRETFDLAWLERIDFAVEANGQRGLYTFLEFFNTWGRAASSSTKIEINGNQQLLNPWNGNQHRQAKQLYIRYLVARYSGFFNTLWSLGNEMEHSPNSGSGFVSAANQFYIPWIRQYDPYDLPITLSENIWKQTNIDVGGNHQQQTISVSESKPIINTELVGGGAPQVMWRGTTIKNATNRKYYRRATWKNFSEGGSGSVEATGLFYQDGAGGFTSVSSMLADNNVRNVMQDHGRLGTFIADLENEIYDLPPLGSSVIGTASLGYKSRGKTNSEYIAYFEGGVNNGASITLKLPSGQYSARWYSPSTGNYSTPQQVSNGDNITSPWKNEFDAVLHLTFSSTSNPEPDPDPEPSQPVLDSVL